ncbi:sigma-70 family RNA polymerase sigma factor [Rugosimonospora africana]|uniref:DNA-directed RNA polymerase sigma-70 factor n=1 Tax=Rugosimonospora africana TaxID=556532 RepID=A0A8J3QR49_9ACTN|nr:sigma-70 family RNA polymerase sigma factor [Rugosimonospora africana]GIH14242.1 DNA-directed RNA polymerase sigma-70 factor [Rugosimonospora africana]
MDDSEWLAGRFEEHRSHLRAVAYRMLGSATEADDAVQDAWLRLNRAGTDGVENLGGWLTTIVARVCLNMLRSRNNRREEPLDTHLPDPVVSPEGESQPEDAALLSDSVGLGLLVVLDSLTPDERLVFVLHDMFELPFDTLAGIVGRTPNATKQLASRARQRIRGAEPPTSPDPVRQRQLVDAFFAAAREGEFDALVCLLHPEVLSRTDGGTERADASMLIRGAAAVAKQATTGLRQWLGNRGAALRPVLVNGSAGVIVTLDGHPVIVMGFTVEAGRITRIDTIADPARVRRIAATVLPADR